MPYYQSTAETFRTPLCLYFHNEHYDAIRSITAFFCKRNYCFNCLTPYDKDLSHNIKCPARCKLCCTVSTGPCPDDNNFVEKCKNCHKTFRNETCFIKHIDHNICQWSKECDKCGGHYRIRGSKNKKNRKDHYCHWEICKYFVI